MAQQAGREHMLPSGRRRKPPPHVELESLFPVESRERVEEREKIKCKHCAARELAFRGEQVLHLSSIKPYPAQGFAFINVVKS